MFSDAVPRRLNGRTQCRFNHLVFRGMEKPERHTFASGSRQEDEPIQPAIGLLASLETVLGGNIPVARIKPDREVCAFPYMPSLFTDCKNIYAAPLKVVRNREFAKWPRAVFVKQQPPQIPAYRSLCW